MDPLSQVVSLLKPQVFAWRMIEAHAPWSIGFPANEHAVFGQIVEGECEVELADGSVMDLANGDFLFLLAPKAWTARTAGAGTPLELKAVFADPGCLLSKSGDPRVTRFMAGAFAFAAPNADLLSGMMPAIVHVRASDVVAGRLGALLTLLGGEAIENRPGRALVLDRLLELVLIELLRRHPSGIGRTRAGLLRGLDDPRIARALRVMHEDARRRWTVVSLAREVGMSRSSFAQHFAATVGSSPINYLFDWRMRLAKDALATGKRPLAEIAELAGYQSVSAFSTAFSRAIGCSPTAYYLARSEADGAVHASPGHEPG